MYSEVLKQSFDEPFSKYLKNSENCLSSHAFIDYIHCPYLFRKKKMGLIPFKDKKSWVLGRAAHKMILEGEDAYNDEYQVGGGPVNPKTEAEYGKTTQKYKDWASQQDKIILTTDQDYTVHMMNSGVMDHESAYGLINEGDQCEKVIRVKHEGLRYQIRMDCFNPYVGLVDLKTCQNVDTFEANVAEYNYLYQMAFYTLVIKWETGLEVPVYFIAIEKQEPFRCAVFILPEHVILEYQIKVLAAIKAYKKALENDEWPTRYEGIRVFNG